MAIRLFIVATISLAINAIAAVMIKWGIDNGNDWSLAIGVTMATVAFATILIAPLDKKGGHHD